MGAAGDTGLSLLLFALGPGAAAGCQLKLKPNQAQPELCQGTRSAGEERGKKRGWGAALGTQGLCCCLPGGVTCWGLGAWCGDVFEVPVGVPLPSKCQPSVLQSGTAALLQAHSWVSCYNDIS